MRNLGQLKNLKRMIRRVKSNGNLPFQSKNYRQTYKWDDMSFETMRNCGYLDVIDTEYYDVKVTKSGVNIYAVKGNDKIELRGTADEKRLAKKLGYEIVAEADVEKIVKGKRHTYQFNLNKMIANYNESLEEFTDFKETQQRTRVNKLTIKVNKTKNRLETIGYELKLQTEKLKTQDFAFGLRKM